MSIHIDRVHTDMEVLASPSTDGLDGSSGGDETLGALRGRSALRERLRPIVLEIVRDELKRIKRRLGTP